MIAFDHRNSVVNAEVRRAAGRMRKRAAQERSGVHSSATVPLALYSDPIVARNTSACDFRIVDLMQAEQLASLYIVIPPSARSEERRVGHECVSTVRSRWSTDHSNKKETATLW